MCIGFHATLVVKLQFTDYYQITALRSSSVEGSKLMSKYSLFVCGRQWRKFLFQDMKDTGEQCVLTVIKCYCLHSEVLYMTT